jgi:ribonuclease D
LSHVITTAPALDELAAHLERAEAIGLDTEFLRERTYRAQLCLVQIAGDTQIACVDPLALPDLGALLALFASRTPVKIMHASRQDLEVLHPIAGRITPVFDTQIAAALVGMPAQVGYAELVKRMLDVQLDKSHTRTDWSRRPLSAEQVAYALDDVRYLLPLKEKLEAELERLGRSQWLDEELASLSDEENFLIDPERAWLRVKGLRGLDPDRTRLAQALAAWRERRAIERNRPRGWILDDGLLREIVLRTPRNEAALAAIAEMPPAFVRNSGAETLALIESVADDYGPPVRERRERPDPEQVARVRRLAGVLQDIARELGVSAEVLATRRDLERIAGGERDVPALQGWRARVIGERLLATLSKG